MVQQNPQWQGVNLSPVFEKRRKLFGRLWEERELKLMSYVTGPRRGGKSVLLRQIVNELLNADKISPRQILWYEFEVGDNKEKIREVFDFFWTEIADTGRKAYVFWDEIQYAHGYETVVKHLYDLYEGKVKFFLTGSLSLWYKRKIQESMAGRYLPYRLFPLSFEEYLDLGNFGELGDYQKMMEEDKEGIRNGLTGKLTPVFRQFLRSGRFPELINLPEGARDLYLDTLVNGALNQDAFGYFDIRRPGELVSLYEYLRLNSGGIISVAKLAERASAKTISAYLEILEAMGLVYFVYNSTDPLIRANVIRKAYVNSALFLRETKLDPVTSTGLAVESYVLERLLERGEDPVTFWRRRNDEVDFLLPRKKLAYEVKFRGEMGGLVKLIRFGEQKKFDLVVATLNKWGKEKGIEYIPACAF